MIAYQLEFSDIQGWKNNSFSLFFKFFDGLFLLGGRCPEIVLIFPVHLISFYILVEVIGVFVKLVGLVESDG